MSYDFFMQPVPRERCEHCGRSDEDPEQLRANYTYNVAPMFLEAFGPGGIYRLRKLKGRDAAPLLRSAIERMESAPEVYRAMNPENGWGSYEGALGILKRLNGWCSEHPEAVLEVW